MNVTSLLTIGTQTLDTFTKIPTYQCSSWEISYHDDRLHMYSVGTDIQAVSIVEYARIYLPDGKVWIFNEKAFNQRNKISDLPKDSYLSMALSDEPITCTIYCTYNDNDEIISVHIVGNSHTVPLKLMIECYLGNIKVDTHLRAIIDTIHNSIHI